VVVKANPWSAEAADPAVGLCSDWGSAGRADCVGGDRRRWRGESVSGVGAGGPPGESPKATALPSDVTGNDVGMAILAQPERTFLPGAAPGVYYLDHGYTVLNPAQFPVDGAIRFYAWSVLNPANGVYNQTDVDNWIAARKLQRQF